MKKTLQVHIQSEVSPKALLEAIKPLKSLDSGEVKKRFKRLRKNIKKAKMQKERWLKNAPKLIKVIED